MNKKYDLEKLKAIIDAYGKNHQDAYPIESLLLMKPDWGYLAHNGISSDDVAVLIPYIVATLPEKSYSSRENVFSWLGLLNDGDD